MNNSDFKSFNIFIDNETVSVYEYLGKDDNGEAKRNLLFKAPRSLCTANMVATVFDNILKK